MLDRTIAPAFKREFSFHLLSPEIVSLPNGRHAYFVHGGEQPVFRIELLFTAGRWHETKAGSAYFAAHLLSKGAAGKSSYEIASSLDQLGAHLDVTAGVDFTTVSLYALTRTAKSALDLLAELIKYPDFTEREFTQRVGIYRQNIKVNHEKTSYLASRLFRKVLYGEDHPYGRETEEHDLDNLAVADVKKFHHEMYTQCDVFVAGKVDDALQQQILSLFALPGSQQASFSYSPKLAEPERIHQEKAGSLQSSLRIGKRAVPRNHADYPEVLFVNHLLGGYFGSRLMKNIREEKGLTYGIHSAVHTMKWDNYMVIGTDVNKELADQAFEEVRKELSRLVEEPVGQAELDVARQHFIGSLQTELSTAFAHADKIRSIALYDLRPDHYSELIKRVDQMDAQRIMAIAAEYFKPESFFEISAG